ncbi:unnamed protein product [Linum tenue]|uniref:Uncharacterized protein n=1 Tax=Linum tenue TaxID=586396 RepID=A0AAV0PN03_9ROSI|nr:unnamed protein product [Linum tenue]
MEKQRMTRKLLLKC